jgi:response regulator RpfG family c-di-GMP phosphodiesterase
MVATLQEAVEAAQDRYGSAEWCLLTPKQQTAAVYREMRRIDAERVVEAARLLPTAPPLPEQTQRDIIQRFLAAGAARDDETGQHVARIGALAHRLALLAGFGHSFAQNVMVAAPLHDIGKIGVPDAILLKPGRLTPEEMAVMRRHADLGAHILAGSRLSLLDLAAEIAISHHENWDGSGYPAGLCGDAIPVSGRIVAIADVFDALLSRRPYKEPWPLEEAVAFLREQAGKRFDPELVGLFLRHLTVMVAIRASHADVGGELTIAAAGRS